ALGLHVGFRISRHTGQGGEGGVAGGVEFGVAPAGVVADLPALIALIGRARDFSGDVECASRLVAAEPGELSQVKLPVEEGVKTLHEGGVGRPVFDFYPDATVQHVFDE